MAASCRSPAAATRSSATSSASGFSDCRASRVPIPTSPSARCCEMLARGGRNRPDATRAPDRRGLGSRLRWLGSARDRAQPPEAQHRVILPDRLERHLDRIVDVDVVGAAIGDVADQARARALRAIELDDAGYIWNDLLELRHERVADHRERVDLSGAWQLHPGEVFAQAVEAVRLRRQYEGAASVTFRRHDAALACRVPEDLVAFVSERFGE